LGEKNRVIVINPQKIVEKLEEAKKVIEDGEKNGKTILLVCDKTVLKDEIERISHKKGMMYLNKKVPSGFFTNFNTFSKRIHSMNKLRKFIESSEFEKLTKKEQLMKKRELKKLEDIYKGVKNLNKLPDLVVVFDAQYYLNVIDELEKV
jgi:small subunit ribosomal protein S2